MATVPPTPGPEPNPVAALSLLGFAMAMSIPGVVLHLSGFHPEGAPLTGILIFGVAIVAAAFVLTWAAEVAELEIGSGLAVVFLALVTVLPEYAVDLNLAWKAGYDASNAPLALMNMTGANRILIGLGWPLVALIVWYRESKTAIPLKRRRTGDVFWLLAATLYSLVIPLKGDVAWYDAVILFAIFAVYVKRSGGHDEEHAVLVGPPRVMGRWAKRKRRSWLVVLFVWAAIAIVASADPFVESLKAAGKALAIPEEYLIQWLAPLASEAPEFVVVILLATRGRAEMGFGAFLSSKINQWTLLVGGVPLAYGLSRLVHADAYAPALALTTHTTLELWLTATQGLYAVASIIDLNFGLRQAMTILFLFLVQLIGSIWMEATGRHDWIEPFHVWLSVLYGVLALLTFARQWKHLVERIRESVGRRA